MSSNPHTSRRQRSIGMLLVPFILSLSLLVAPGCDNFLGLQDWQRDLLNLGLAGLGNGGAMAVALLTGGNTTPSPTPDPLPGIQGPAGEQGAPGADGASGADGTPGTNGEDGTELFHIFIDDYFAFVNPDCFGPLPLGEFPVAGGTSPVQVREPVLGYIGDGTPLSCPTLSVAFRALIPPDYAGANPVTLRLAFRRMGGTLTQGPFAFNVYVRRLVDGSNTIDNYVSPNPPVTTVSVTPPAPGNDFEFQIIDLPINVAVPEGLGGAALSAGNLLAVELETVGEDGGLYLLLGVEFYETTEVPAVMGGTIS